MGDLGNHKGGDIARLNGKVMWTGQQLSSGLDGKVAGHFISNKDMT
jgi:hypothetical protein